jgi:hypothetical protein
MNKQSRRKHREILESVPAQSGGVYHAALTQLCAAVRYGNVLRKAQQNSQNL